MDAIVSIVSDTSGKSLMGGKSTKLDPFNYYVTTAEW